MSKLGLGVAMVVCVSLASCGLGGPGAAARQREANAYGLRTTADWQAKKRAEADKSAAAVQSADNSENERKEAMLKRATDVVALDGHPKGPSVLSAMIKCEDGFTRKCDHRWVAKQVSKVVFLAGMAVREPNGEKAETMMAEAEQLAEKKAADRTAAADKQKEADDRIQAELKRCATDHSPCVEACKADAASSACVALGVYAITGDTKDDRFDRAIVLFNGPCKAGITAACDSAKKATKERDELFAPVNDAWSNVKTIGDDLATKKFLHAFAQQNLKGPRNARAAQNMAAHIAAITKDSYCPAVTEFLKVSTRAEFAKRAKAHCADDPPTATGLGGNEVELKSECAAVYATACAP